MDCVARGQEHSQRRNANRTLLRGLSSYRRATRGMPGRCRGGSRCRNRFGRFLRRHDGAGHGSGALPAPNEARTDGPFATIARARDAVRQEKRTVAKKDFVVLFRGGIYRLAETVVFSLDDAAPQGGTITYAAYRDEQPILSSGVPVRNWRRPNDEPKNLPDAAARQGMGRGPAAAARANIDLVRRRSSAAACERRRLRARRQRDKTTAAERITFPPGAPATGRTCAKAKSS